MLRKVSLASRGAGLALGAFVVCGALATVHAADGSAPPGRPDLTTFPNGPSTGVPDGTDLTEYRGPCGITVDGTVIDAKVINCSLDILADDVHIRRSRINGTVATRAGTTNSLTLVDSEVDAGVVQLAAVGSTNLTIRRANIRGGQTSVYCFSNCDIRDSWLHGQGIPAGEEWHLGGFLANDDGDSGRTDAVLIHNTIHCDAPANDVGGGCSGNINLFGDFGQISHVTIDNNLFRANIGISYCVYGGDAVSKPYPNAEHVVFTNNVFERGESGQCGEFGPVSSFNSFGTGNAWTDNVWDTGEQVVPED